MKNFETLLTQYANEKGFAINSNGQLWAKCLAKFQIYSDWYQTVMPYSFFKANVIGE